jgi:hypothetical protein
MAAMRALRYAGRSRSACNIDLPPLVRDLRVIVQVHVVLDRIPLAMRTSF